MSNPDDLRIAARRQLRPSLDADRIAQLRARIDAGTYASEVVIQATARAIVEGEGL